MFDHNDSEQECMDCRYTWRYFSEDLESDEDLDCPNCGSSYTECIGSESI